MKRRCDPPKPEKQKKKKKYPFIGVRFAKDIDERIRELSERSGESMGRLLNQMARRHLPELERAAGIKAK